MKKLLSFIYNKLNTCYSNVKAIGIFTGAVDGTHVVIKAPKRQNIPRVYYNRKSQMSVILQVCCDASCSLTDVYAGWPGSVHDSKVYRASPLSHIVNTLPERYDNFYMNTIYSFE